MMSPPAAPCQTSPNPVRLALTLLLQVTNPLTSPQRWCLIFLLLFLGSLFALHFICRRL